LLAGRGLLVVCVAAMFAVRYLLVDDGWSVMGG
jgi:hypothetical protein